MNGKIYSLNDPITKEVRYIGFTRNRLSHRYSQHRHEALVKKRCSHVYNWYRSCLSKYNAEPLIFLIEDGIAYKDWQDRETYWIDQYNSLTNQRSGGCGVHVSTKGSGRTRSVEARKEPVIQLSLAGYKVKRWDSIADAERSIAGGITGNIYRAKGLNGTAFGYRWLLADQYDKRNEPYQDPLSNPVYCYCLYTKKLLKRYDTAAAMVQAMGGNASLVTQALNKNLVYLGSYFVRRSENTHDAPEPKTIYCYEGCYYDSFSALHKAAVADGYSKSRVHHLKSKTDYVVQNITEDIVRTLRETVR